MQRIRSVVLMLALVPVLALCGCGGKAGAGPLTRAIAQFEAEDYQGAKASFEAMQLKEPESVATKYYLLRIALQTGELDTAVEGFEGLVETDPESSDYHYWLAQAYVAKLQAVKDMMQQAQLAGKVLSTIKKSIDLDPDNVSARRFLGGFYLNAPPIAGGSVEKARQQAEEIGQRDSVMGRSFTAAIHLKLKEYDQAIAVFGEVAGLQPGEADPHFQIGMIQQTQENYAEAFTSFDRALAIDPEHRASLYQFGRTCVFTSDNYDRAVEYMRKYLSLEFVANMPTFASAHWRLGMIYQNANQKELARHEFEAALELEPDHKDAKAALQGLDG